MAKHISTQAATVNLSASTVVATDMANTLGVVLSWDYGTDHCGDAIQVPRAKVAEILAAQGFDTAKYMPEIGAELALARAHREIHWGARVGMKRAVKIVRLESADANCPASYGIIAVNTGAAETARSLHCLRTAAMM